MNETSNYIEQHVTRENRLAFWLVRIKIRDAKLPFDVRVSGTAVATAIDLFDELGSVAELPSKAKPLVRDAG